MAATPLTKAGLEIAPPWKRQLSDTTCRVTRTLRLGVFEELFGKAAEKNIFAMANSSSGELVAGAPRPSRYPRQISGSDKLLEESSLLVPQGHERKCFLKLSQIHRKERNPLQCQN